MATVLLATCALFVFTMNCSGGLTAIESGASASNSDSPQNPGEVDPTLPKSPLVCTNKASLETGAMPPLTDLISAAGRISTGESAAGFLDQDGKLFFISGDDVISPDPSQRYRWFSFSLNDWSPAKYFSKVGPTRCGLTMDSKVRCYHQTLMTWSEITELQGSVQVAGFDRSLCGLKMDGKVLCLNEYLTPNEIVIDEKISLITPTWFVGASGKGYYAPSALAQTGESIYYFNNVLTDTTTFSVDLKKATVCDINFKNYSVTSFSSVRAFSCGVSERGRLYCQYYPDRYKPADDQLIVNSEGKTSYELSSIEPTNRYLAVRIFDSGLACAIRSDFKVSCFSLGYGSALVNAAKKLGLDLSANVVAKVPEPDSITDFVTTNQKACVLKAGKIFCIDVPVINLKTGAVSTLFPLDPEVSYKKIFPGYFKNGGFQRVCGLTSSGELKCQNVHSKNSQYVEKREMENVDPGVTYVDYLNWGISDNCGWRESNNGIRCLSGYEDGQAPKETQLGKVVSTIAGVYHLNDGTYVRAGHETPMQLRDAQTGQIYRAIEAVDGHPSVMLCSDGKLRVNRSTDFVLIGSSELAKLNGSKFMERNAYYEKAARRCTYINTNSTPAVITERSCDVLYFPGIDKSWVAARLGIYQFIRDDGAFFWGQGSTEIYYIRPQLISPIL